MGFVCASISLIVDNIRFYFLGGREAASAAFGHAPQILTIDLILTGMVSQLIIWLILTLLSMSAGGLAAFLPGVNTRK